MIVRYARKRDYSGEGHDPSFTLGNSYLVIGVDFIPLAQACMISVPRDSDGTPVLIDMQYFEVENAEIPPHWSFHTSKGGGYSICPDDFIGDFWDRFHDGDLAAEKLYADVLKGLIEFHGPQ